MNVTPQDLNTWKCYGCVNLNEMMYLLIRGNGVKMAAKEKNVSQMSNLQH